MDRLQVPPPQKFDFSKPEEWPKWIKRFERFSIASTLERQAEENQVNALIYTMGEEAEDILTSLRLTPDEARKNIATADVLSRVPDNGQGENQPEEEINLYVNTVLSSLPATEKRLLEIQKHQENDAVLREVRKHCLEGWPNKFNIDDTVQQYYPFS
ncbi:hypothetical protein NFI96_030791, partial [Prochilodus magdalenae]